MNRNDVKLERLFAAARDEQREVREPMPPYLAQRILAHWRTREDINDSWHMLVRLFRRGLACAGVVMLFALAWGHDSLDLTPDNDDVYADYELRADLMP